jgi:hypothetical protein
MMCSARERAHRGGGEREGARAVYPRPTLPYPHERVYVWHCGDWRHKTARESEKLLTAMEGVDAAATKPLVRLRHLLGEHASSRLHPLSKFAWPAQIDALIHGDAPVAASLRQRVPPAEGS